MAEVHAYSFVEDWPSAEAIKKIVKHCNGSRRNPISLIQGFPKVMNGKSNVKKKAHDLIGMSRNSLHVISLVDLDADDCAPELIQEWFERPPQDLPGRLVFRVAVHEVESWIMADRIAFSSFLGISPQNIDQNPDALTNPKKRLFSILCKKGKKKWHRDMLPQGNASIGPLYNEKLCDFIVSKWDPERAAKNSPSLSGAIEAVKKL